MRLLHTSDLQIGKVFLFASREQQALLQEARQGALRRLGEAAVLHGARAVLVAGDVYDKQQLTGETIDKPLEAMRAFPGVEFHLIPGNHDHYVERGLWDRVKRRLPGNVFVHLAPGPVPIAAGSAVPVYLLPAPLALRASTDDLTAWMDDAPTPEGAIRVGMAHGSITGFGTGSGTGSDVEGESRDNYVSPQRPERAGLAYLAMGDWHRLQRIGDRLWYSGTPEPDQFKRPPGPEGAATTRCNGGQALLVEIEGPRALPVVTPIDVGHFTWHEASETLDDEASIERLERRLRALSPDLSRVCLKLRVEGTLSLADRRRFDERIGESLRAALSLLRLDAERLVLQPTEADLDAIDGGGQGGFVRAAADRLRAIRADDPDPRRRQVAERALHRLYLEHLKLEADR